MANWLWIAFGMRLLSYSNLWQLQQGVIIGPLHQGVKTLLSARVGLCCSVTKQILFMLYHNRQTVKQTSLANSWVWFRMNTFHTLTYPILTNKGAEKLCVTVTATMCFGMTQSEAWLHMLSMIICIFQYATLENKLEILISLFFQDLYKKNATFLWWKMSASIASFSQKLKLTFFKFTHTC